MTKKTIYFLEKYNYINLKIKPYLCPIDENSEIDFDLRHNMMIIIVGKLKIVMRTSLND